MNGNYGLIGGSTRPMSTEEQLKMYEEMERRRSSSDRVNACFHLICQHADVAELDDLARVLRPFAIRMLEKL